MAEWVTTLLLREPGHEHTPASHIVLSSVRVETNGYHDRVSVWNRGGHSGTLTVTKGDGAAVAKMLMPEGEVQ